MNNFVVFLIAIVSFVGLNGCSTGDYRLVNDALSGSNGKQVTYPNQSETDYVGDIRVVTGMRNGSYFNRYKNTGKDYCKVRVKLENGSNRTLRLEPGENRSGNYGSVYNQIESVQTMCNEDRRVFSAPFDS